MKAVGQGAWHAKALQPCRARRRQGEASVTFVVGKLLWAIVAPGNLLLLVLLVGVLRAGWTHGRRGFGLIAAAALGLVAIAALPLGPWLAAPLENRFPAADPPAAVDGIVVLGGSVDPGLSRARGQIALVAAAGRITETVVLARRYPAARVVVSGGEAAIFPEGLSEAAATRDLLIALGVAPGRIEVESRSRNTQENAVLSYETAQPKPGESWLLVTSAMHMPRAVGCFRRIGWPIAAYPVDYRTSTTIGVPPGLLLADDLVLVNLAVKEWLGLVAYYALGRTDTLFPAP
jgi:uncharacterized SAM-binding protein YcdF (DUF218 family)